MTQDEIIEMARQVGIIFHGLGNTPEELEAFAKLVAAKKVEGMVMMTPDEFKSVWDKAQAEEREALCQAMEDKDTWDLYDPAATAIKVIRAREQS